MIRRVERGWVLWLRGRPCAGRWTGPRDFLSAYADGGPGELVDVQRIAEGVAAWLGRELWLVRIVGTTGPPAWWRVTHVDHDRRVRPRHGPHEPLPAFLLPILAGEGPVPVRLLRRDEVPMIRRLLWPERRWRHSWQVVEEDRHQPGVGNDVVGGGEDEADHGGEDEADHRREGDDG